MPRHQPKFFGQVKDGKVVLGDSERQRMMERVTYLNGERIQITVDRLARKRSLPQNDYYWACVIEMLTCHIEGASGRDRDYWHAYCKLRFLPEIFGVPPIFKSEWSADDVRRASAILSTTTLNTGDFSSYTERIRDWAAAELQLDIPDPEKHWRHFDTRQGEEIKTKGGDEL